MLGSKPCPENPKPQENRRKSSYHFGPCLVSGALFRYKDLQYGVYFVLKRNGLNRLPNGRKTRSLSNVMKSWFRDQLDVKFLTFVKNGRKIRRFQYTAIDDATRARALKVYDRHTRKNAIDFVKHSRFVSIRSRLTMATSIRPCFTGIVRITDVYNQTTITSPQRKSRAISQNRQTGVLAVNRVHRRYRHQSQIKEMGNLS